MTFEENERFNDVVESFKKLNINDKKSVTISELKSVIIFLSKFMENKPIDKSVSFNKEIQDTELDIISEDDYTEAIYVYTNMLKEMLASYVDYSESK